MSEILEKYKKCQYEIKDIDIKRDEGIVTIAISSFNNIDSDGDIMANGAFSKTIKERINRIRHLKDHDRSMLLGFPIEMFETNDYLIARSKMNLDKSIVKDTFSDYKFFAENHKTIEHSIGFRGIKGRYENIEETGGFLFKEVMLYEYSTLSFLGANENTPLIDLKSMLKSDYTDNNLKLIESLINRVERLEKEIEKYSQTIDIQKAATPDIQPLHEIVANTDTTETFSEGKTILNLEKILNHFKNGK